ncbi:hypothetical protein Cni_G09647 [Canna indica]|uniref:Uncharacterized protein n=1 Tax=Canna indica TaxID=4628 RepID=A0AAQ3K4E6_9LILI|nr:hypothetical protein Cni_G09647 [Canna indica]
MEQALHKGRKPQSSYVLEDILRDVEGGVLQALQGVDAALRRGDKENPLKQVVLLSIAVMLLALSAAAGNAMGARTVFGKTSTSTDFFAGIENRNIIPAKNLTASNVFSATTLQGNGEMDGESAVSKRSVPGGPNPGSDHMLLN